MEGSFKEVFKAEGTESSNHPKLWAKFLEIFGVECCFLETVEASFLGWYLKELRKSNLGSGI
uniref:Uncharacterized protein n=1 Tax=Nelumbo nucifera TaxID=4432 RepID=A0A822Y213_NELNU|nr:TPA_asm: hypothetical protein HUJ06_025161 [Nelumbo nucifera]